LEVRYRELSADGSKYANSEQGRHFLSYLINCALLPTQGAYAIVDGRRYDFPGGLGFAPHWLDRPLTEGEQRWVSAGILALTNFFGKHVQISMRNPNSGFTSLKASQEEAEEFTLYEGDFFGNVFADPSVSCVARAPRTPGEEDDPVLAVRVGTQIDPDIPPSWACPSPGAGSSSRAEPTNPTPIVSTASSTTNTSASTSNPRKADHGQGG
jgi:hypothetical protein